MNVWDGAEKVWCTTCTGGPGGPAWGTMAILWRLWSNRPTAFRSIWFVQSFLPLLRSKMSRCILPSPPSPIPVSRRRGLQTTNDILGRRFWGRVRFLVPFHIPLSPSQVFITNPLLLQRDFLAVLIRSKHLIRGLFFYALFVCFWACSLRFVAIGSLDFNGVTNLLAHNIGNVLAEWVHWVVFFLMALRFEVSTNMLLLNVLNKRNSYMLV